MPEAITSPPASDLQAIFLPGKETQDLASGRCAVNFKECLVLQRREDNLWVGKLGFVLHNGSEGFLNGLGEIFVPVGVFGCCNGVQG